MRCPQCNSDNRDSAKFCAECGRAFPKKCPSCGEDNGPRAKFCNECGTPLQAPAARPSRPEPAAIAHEAGSERRQLTVMFCDLVASTELSARLDPEDLRDVIRSFQRVATDEIVRLEGHVAQHLGDGLLVYFGYPKAHEDDAVRSGHAALGIIAAVGRLNERLQREQGLSLAVRVGVHTGPTVVGDVGGEGQERLAIGETPNFAARLQSVAQPDAVVVSAATERLLRRAFETQSLGELELKGFANPREVFRLIAPVAKGAAGPAPTPLVGRDKEVSALGALFEQACNGEGTSVLIHGEAGLGKSRLCAAVSTLVAQRPGTLELHARGSTFYAHTPLRPAAELTRMLLGIEEDDPPRALVAAIDRLVTRLELSDPHCAVLLAALVGLEVEVPAMTPQIRKRRTLASLVEAFTGTARHAPVVIVLEDLQWVDETTLELVGALLDRMAGVAGLLVLTARPQFDPPWHVETEIALHQLPREAVEHIIARVAGRPLSQDLVTQIVLKAEGNPLFAEELAQMVVESDLIERKSGEAVALAIPATLKDSLMARLDRLSPARKSLVQLCATIGRRFSRELLREILRSFGEDMQNELRRLTDGELLFQRGLPPRSLFVFKHGLVQESAYESLLRRTRRQYHGRVADVLLERFPDTLPEVLAHHLTEANRPAEAIDLWHAAGSAALGAFALGDSTSHLTRGLACLETLPDDEQRVPKELAVRGTLGVPLMLTQGFAAPDVEDHYSRMLELCERAGDEAAEQLFPSLWGLWTFYIVSGQHQRAEEVALKLQGLGARTGRSAIELAGQTALGGAVLMRGRPAEARRAFERGLEIYDPQQHASLALLFGQDAGAMCLAFLTWAHVTEGDDQAARKRAAEADALCETLEQPSTRAFVDTVLATWCCLDGDAARALSRSETVIGLAADQGMPHWDAQASITRGWALAQTGRGEEGIAGLRGGIAGLTGMGSMATMTLYWAGLAEAELAA
ncbi:MAG: AAA family ATPase, partial [Deltaproteobacteria bacterium]|nr:AAA family ATPase [Deltaproteobacteria bacterium]